MEKREPIYKKQQNPYTNPYFVAFLSVFLGPIAYGWWSKKAAFAAFFAAAIMDASAFYYCIYAQSNYGIFLLAVHFVLVFYTFKSIGCFHFYYEYDADSRRPYPKEDSADNCFALDTFFGLLGMCLAIVSLIAGYQSETEEESAKYNIVMLIPVAIGLAIKVYSQSTIQEKFAKKIESKARLSKSDVDTTA